MKIFSSNSKIFTILLSVLYIIGLCASFYHLEIILSIVVFLFLVGIVFFTKFDLKKIIILFLIFFFAIYRANKCNDFNGAFQNVFANNVKITGQVISSKNVSNKNQKIRFYVKANNLTIYNKKKNTEYNNINSKILITTDLNTETENKIAIGRHIEIKGKLSYPKPAGNPHQFDYKQYLVNNDCLNILYGDYKSLSVTKEPSFSIKNLNESWYYILNKFEVIRLKILKQHSKHIPSDRLKILGSLVFGDETINPDDKIKEDFKNSGLLHLLAASGLNVTLIYGIWWWIASLVRIPYNFSILTGAVFVIFYTFMTGFPPSIIRAGIIILFVLFGKLIDRNVNSVALVFFAAFLILVFNPKMLFDIGFQLSFIVTLGLIICCPVAVEKFKDRDERYKEKFKNKPKVLKFALYLFSPINLASAVFVPLVAQLWVIPLQMHYFNNFAPLSILANIAVVPFIGILSFIGFLSSIIALIPVLNTYIVFLFDLIANPLLLLLIKISEFFASFKFSIISTKGLNLLQIFEFWGIVLLFTLNLKNNFNNKKHRIFLLLSVILFSFSFIKPEYFSNNLEVIMFDVENSDCFLVKTPKRKYIMIDTGKKTYKGQTSADIIINKYLKNERISNIENLIITHFNTNYSGGAIDILKNEKVKNIILKDKNENTLHSVEILNYLKENNLNYKIAKNNDVIYSEPNFKITTFIPNGSENEASIITLLTYSDKNILLLAGNSAKGFKSIENYLPDKIDIVKIGNYGALNSVDSDMIKRIKPKYALISSKENDLSHPDIKTVNLLYKNDVKIFSTKDYGFVKIVLENNDINFYHFDKFNRKIKKIIIPETKSFQDLYVQNFVKNYAE